VKKLFSTILVICSLLGGNGYAETLILKCNGGDYKYLNWNIDTVNMNATQEWHMPSSWSKGSNNYKLLTVDDEKITYLSQKKGFMKPRIEGMFYYKEPYRYLWDSYNVTNLRCINESVIQKSSTSTDDKITQSKQICKDLGFKTNTEKFADCALKMMTIEFETTNKVASSGGTKQEIIIKQQNDYDVFDAMLDISNSMLSNNSGNSSSSSSSSGTRCIAQKTHAWGHTVINCN